MEKVNDIADEMMGYADKPPPRGAWIDMAERLRKAWRSECADMEFAISSAHEALKEAIEERKPGHAAAIRAALRTLRQRFDNDVMAYQDRYFKFSGWNWHKKAAEAARWRDVFHELREVCDAALAEPARNCDLVPVEAPEAADVFHSERPGHGYDYETHDWLLAPAAERKGDGDGSK